MMVAMVSFKRRIKLSSRFLKIVEGAYTCKLFFNRKSRNLLIILAILVITKVAL